MSPALYKIPVKVNKTSLKSGELDKQATEAVFGFTPEEQNPKENGALEKPQAGKQVPFQWFELMSLHHNISRENAS